MIFVTGDTHGEFNRFNAKSFPIQSDLCKYDCVIICGDFGGVWNYSGETDEEKYWLDWLDGKNFTTLFCDGNHENFVRLNEYPVKEWHGGLVHEIRPSVLHLMRGEMFDIGGKKVFAFGGARSHDIKGMASYEELKADYSAGVLRPDAPDYTEKKRYCEKNFIFAREENISWWAAEDPSDEEMQHGLDTLEKNQWKCDYVITHDAPSQVLRLHYIDGLRPNPLNKYFDLIWNKLQYEKWFFGHHHEDRRITVKDYLMYYDIRLADDY